jgi:isoleucyl-tRNA synthetase
MHKPEIDEITIKCKCGGQMNRVEEVLDVWFDSGVSSWAALGYPQYKDDFKKFWPADINIEGKDQVRGWWNSQLILSTIAFDKKPQDNIMVHGMVLDLGKKKMSKSLGNIISPQEIIDKYGRDFLRYYFAKISKGEDFSFDEKEFEEIRKVMTILQNVITYGLQVGKSNCKAKRMEIEDKWILSRLNSVIKQVTECFNSYTLPKAVEILENFLINEVSRGYIQMIRERADKKEEAVSYCLNLINETLIKLLAPIIPFTAESSYLKLKEALKLKEESIHLTEWPEISKKMIDEKLEKEMETAKQLITFILAEREKEKIGVRWPLAKVTVSNPEIINKELQELVLRQTNIKRIEIKKGESKISLDTKMTPELEAEGFAREIVRRIQDARKKAGMQKSQSIDLLLIVDEKLKKLLKNHEKMIQEKTNSDNLKIESHDGKKAKIGKFGQTGDAEIRDKKVMFGFDIL